MKWPQTPSGRRVRQIVLVAASSAAMLASGRSTIAVASTPAPAPPSAIGDDVPLSIAVSPAFAQTGLAAAAAVPSSPCPKNDSCTHLWVTRDGGAKWTRAAGRGWEQGVISIAADAHGHDTLFSAAAAGLLRSDDQGDSWTRVGDTGMVTPAPSFPSDRTVAVAGGTDYLLVNGSAHPIAGSGGTLKDFAFMYAPSFPASGNRSPALLVGSNPQSGVPVIQHCDATLTCSGGTTPAGASPFPPFALLPSSDYGADGTVFLQTGRGVAKSVDGGLTFTPLQVVSTTGANATATPGLGLAPGYREAGPTRTVYVAVIQAFISQTQADTSHTSGGIYRSSDGGATWVNVSSGTPFDNGATALAVASTGRLFAGYAGNRRAGILCSDGSGWSAACAPVGGGTAATGAKAPTKGGSAGCSGSNCAAATSGAGAPSGNQTGGGAPPGGTSGGGGPDTAALAAQAAARRGTPGLQIAIAVALGLTAAAAVVAVFRRRARRRADNGLAPTPGEDG
jgi:hypothetical protein